MILTNEFLRRESIKRDISNASETRILNENYTVFSKKESYDLFISHSFLAWIVKSNATLLNDKPRMEFSNLSICAV